MAAACIEAGCESAEGAGAAGPLAEGILAEGPAAEEVDVDLRGFAGCVGSALYAGSALMAESVPSAGCALGG